MDKNAANLHDADAALEVDRAAARGRARKACQALQLRPQPPKQYLYQLRYYQKKGRELAALGVTMDNLDEMLCDNGGGT